MNDNNRKTTAAMNDHPTDQPTITPNSGACCTQGWTRTKCSECDGRSADLLGVTVAEEDWCEPCMMDQPNREAWGWEFTRCANPKCQWWDGRCQSCHHFDGRGGWCRIAPIQEKKDPAGWCGRWEQGRVVAPHVLKPAGDPVYVKWSTT